MKSNYLSDLRTRRSFLRQAACAAVGSLAVTNCLRDLRLVNAALAQGPLTGYKALICVFQNGGNDSNNLIIPTSTSEYANYATIRTPALALPNVTSGVAPALALKTSGGGTYMDGDGHSFGFHPAMVEMANLFQSGQCAPILNVGSLCYPTTKTQYQTGSVPIPPQLYSHSDQQVQWQTSIPDQAPTSGWGGRVSDLFTTAAINSGAVSGISMAMTVAGSNVFEVGGTNLQPQYSVTTNGAIPLSGATNLQTQMKTILGGATGLLNEAAMNDLQTATYANTVYNAIAEANTVNNALTAQNSSNPSWLSGDASTNITTPNGGSTFSSSLMAQLKMVARLIDIGARPTSGNVNGGTYNGLAMKRQIFFVQVGGYDTHTVQTGNAGQTTTNNAQVVIGQQANLLAEISKSLSALLTAVSTPGFANTSTTAGSGGLGNSVTAFTVSDFARTFPSNGSGSDHGWGGHHLVVGGAVKGGATYGHLPVLTVGGPSDTGTGRWIPTTSVDQYAATLAAWFGVTDPADLASIFPNLNRFASANLGFI